MSDTIKLSVVVPCYNEEGNLKALYKRLKKVCAEVAPDAYEILLVNDGSHDGTWPVIESLALSDPYVTAVNLSRNYGNQTTLMTGLYLCRGERALIVDADLQDPPELLPEMMRRMDEGYDVVHGKRASREGETLLKRWMAEAFLWTFNHVCNVKLPPHTGDFRLMNRKVLNALKTMPESNRFFRGMMAWVGFKQTSIEYIRQRRLSGRTSYNFRKLVNLAFDALTSFSTSPLRVAFYVAAVGGTLSLGLILASLFAEITLFLFIVGAIGLVLSIQCFFLGILGEYAGRILQEAKRRPLCFVSDLIRDGAAEPLEKLHGVALAR